MKPLLKSLLVALALLTCASGLLCYTSHEKNKKAREEALKNEDYVPSLASYDVFYQLRGEPLSARFNDVLSVKVVYELRREKLYYMNSALFQYHYNFCNKVLGDYVPLEVFNTENYGAYGARKYLLANINYYKQSKIYTLEFSSEDEISGPQIAQLYKAIKESSYIGDALKVLVGSSNLVKLDAKGQLKVPKIYPSDVYGAQTFQVVNGGTAYGILRKIEDLQKEYTQVQPGDIIIVKGTPVNVPVCAGIITNSFQTPLSHISVLCHNRNIPAATDIHVWNNASIDSLVNQPIRLFIDRDSIHLSRITAEELKRRQAGKTGNKSITLTYDAAQTQLVPGRDLSLQRRYSVGNKAAGMGELYRVSRKRKHGFSVPEGIFAIPFFYYRQHVSNPAIQKEINELLSNPVYVNDAGAARNQLKKIRKAIKDQPVSPALLQAVSNMIATNGAGNAYRFRSSSNAEDMEGFSGAGLYDSKTGIVGDTAKPIAKAIQAVWASTWSEEAYRERSWAGINQQSIMMGILVHRNFPDEASNGVAITRNMYRSGFPGYTVNVQLGDINVVSPPDSVVCEQFVCMESSRINPLSDGITADYITYSNLNKGKPILKPAQVTQLFYALDAVKSYFYWNLAGSSKPESYEDYALDIEFKFEKDGTLYLKQVRPYR